MEEKRFCRGCGDAFTAHSSKRAYCRKSMQKLCMCGNTIALICSPQNPKTCGCSTRLDNSQALKATKFWDLLSPKNDLPLLSEATVKSKLVVLWRISPCKHDWPSSINQVVKYNQVRCQICSGKKVVKGVNDLATLSPAIAALWDPKNTLKPTQVSSHSNKISWWICTQGHPSHRTSISKKVGGAGCPFCSNRALLPGYNDLATRYPYLADEWDSCRNATDASNVMPGTMKSYWWLCSYGHSYELSPNRRTGGRGCTVCSKQKQISSVEQAVASFIKELYPFEEVVLSDRSILDGKEIDILLPGLNKGIEVNGDFWHSNSAMLRKTGLDAHRYHSQKLKVAESKGIDLVFVWDKDWRSKKEVLKEDIENFLKQGRKSQRLQRTQSLFDLHSAAFIPFDLLEESVGR